MKYIVPIIYTGLANFIVEADSPEAAQQLASARFNDGSIPDMLGNESEEIVRVGTVEVQPADSTDTRP